MTVYLNNVHVPVEGLLGGCKTILEVSAHYAQERKQFNTSIADFPLTQQKLAAMAAQLMLSLSQPAYQLRIN